MLSYVNNMLQVIFILLCLPPLYDIGRQVSVVLSVCLDGRLVHITLVQLKLLPLIIQRMCVSSFIWCEVMYFSLKQHLVYFNWMNCNEFQHLFDPINPDKDTMETRKLNPRERQDNEFWLLQRLEDIMESANFHPLPQAVVDKAMQEHKVGDGVRVICLYTKYLRCT